MDGRVGCGNPKGVLYRLPHCLCTWGWHQGGRWLKFRSFPSPLGRGDGSIHGACVLPERVSGLSLTLRCGVVWAATQQVLRCGPALRSPSCPGGQEPLLSCLPRLGSKWKELLGCEGERFQQQLPPPLLWGTATMMGQ